MNTPIAIQKLSAQLGLTSRTLRHWELEGLFSSMRDKDSGWRVYDETAVFRIHITVLLRSLDIPIKGIKTVLNSKTYGSLRGVISEQLSVLRYDQTEAVSLEKRLVQFLSLLEMKDDQVISDTQVTQLLTGIKSTRTPEYKTEEYIMSNTQNVSGSLRFITLPPMRTVYNTAVGVSPEEEAMNPVLEWLELAKLTGTARMFGGDVPPMPKGDGKPYGYGMCASIPEGIEVPRHLKEMRLPGGLYAMLESTDDISASWKKLMKPLSDDEHYISDRSRLCLEEHIRNDKNGFFITLLEPVKATK